MELRPWQLLPDEMRTKEVRKYYNILMKHRMWLEMKRVLDVIVAGIMLAVLIIPMGIIALAIRLDSPGPVFFRQARVTQYGRIFRIYKFRTMVDNASKLGAGVTVGTCTCVVVSWVPPLIISGNAYVRSPAVLAIDIV